MEPVKLCIELPVAGSGAAILSLSKLKAVSRRLGFDSVQRERMELVLTEILTNQQKYAGGKGMLQIWETKNPYPALDIFAIDYGPGIKQVANAAEDGFSTSGTMGHGLGTIRRLSSESALYSLTDKSESTWTGVAVWSRFTLHKEKSQGGLSIGVYLRPYQDSPFNGDCIFFKSADGKLKWIHMDGLGHGKLAADTVSGAGSLLEVKGPPIQVMESASEAFKGGRGAVGIAGELDPGAGTVELCGVGDMMSVYMEGGETQSVRFAPGILGHAHRSLETRRFELKSGMVITASDGLKSSWKADMFPGLWRLHPQMVALFLGCTLGRISDDRSVFIIKLEGEGSDGR